MSKSTIDPKHDGISHINIYSKGATELGRLLSNFAHTPVALPDHGYFASIEGYWYWLQTGQHHAELRKLHGFRAKQVGRQLRGPVVPGTLPSFEFEERIKIALRCKIEQHPRIQTLLKESKLPFLHYYVTNGRVDDRTPGALWMIDVFTKWREQHVSTTAK